LRVFWFEIQVRERTPYKEEVRPQTFGKKAEDLPKSLVELRFNFDQEYQIWNGAED